MDDDLLKDYEDMLIHRRKSAPQNNASNRPVGTNYRRPVDSAEDRMPYAKSNRSLSQQSTTSRPKTSSTVRSVHGTRTGTANSRPSGSRNPKKSSAKRKQLKRKMFVRKVNTFALVALLVGGAVFGISKSSKGKEIQTTIPNSENSAVSLMVDTSPEVDWRVIQQRDNAVEYEIVTKFDGLSDEQLLDYKNPEFTYISNYGDGKYLYANDDYLMQMCVNVVEKINDAYKSNGYTELPEDLAFTVFGIAKMESSARIEDVDGNVLHPAGGGSAAGICQMQPGAALDGFKYLISLGLADDFGLNSNNYEQEGRQNPYQEIAMATADLARIYSAYCSKVNSSIDKSRVSGGNDNNWILFAYNQGEGTLKNCLWGNDEYVENLIKNGKSEQEARRIAKEKRDSFYDYINFGGYSKSVDGFESSARDKFLQPANESSM